MGRRVKKTKQPDVRQEINDIRLINNSRLKSQVAINTALIKRIEDLERKLQPMVAPVSTLRDVTEQLPFPTWREYTWTGAVKPKPDAQKSYLDKTDENIKYVRDNVTYAMRHMCGWDIERKLGNSLFCRILFKQRMDISVQFTDRTMSITFTRRDGQRVDEVFSDFGKGSTTLASIMMFYCLRS